jgi:cell division protein FtsW
MIDSKVRITEQGITSKPRRHVLGFDPGLLVIVGVMVAFGMVMVYSASWDVSWRLYQDHSVLFSRQIGNLLFGLAAMAVAAFFPLEWIKKYALHLIVVTALILMIVLVMNLGGEYRRSFLEGRVQPSEMAKLALVIYLAVWMESKDEKLADMGYGFMPLVFIIGIFGGLIILQPDLSAGLTIAMVALGMFYLAGAKITQTLLLIVGGGGMAFLVVRFYSTGAERFSQFTQGLVDIEQASYHVQQSLQAFYSGGVFGRGLGASHQKFGFLPAPHTDSIFAIIGEELGLVGALFVLSLFCIFFWRGFRVALSSEDRIGLLLAGGVTFWIGIEALINMAVLLGLLPFAGNALPFFSYGGSSLVTTLAGVGLLLNISRRIPVEIGLRGTVETLGFGRRDRRRRISRLGRGRRAGR